MTTGLRASPGDPAPAASRLVGPSLAEEHRRRPASRRTSIGSRWAPSLRAPAAASSSCARCRSKPLRRSWRTRLDGYAQMLVGSYRRCMAGAGPASAAPTAGSSGSSWRARMSTTMTAVMTTPTASTPRA